VKLALRSQVETIQLHIMIAIFCLLMIRYLLFIGKVIVNYWILLRYKILQNMKKIQANFLVMTLKFGQTLLILYKKLNIFTKN